MVLAFGALMVVLGLLSGGVLTAAALEVTKLQPGWTAWLAYPGLTLLGYGLFVVPANDGPIQLMTKVSGALCLLLGMVAIAVLVLRSLGFRPSRAAPSRCGGCSAAACCSGRWVGWGRGCRRRALEPRAR